MYRAERQSDGKIFALKVMNLAISDKIGLNAYKSEVSTLVSLEGNDKIL